jgi:hypothetical protein
MKRLLIGLLPIAGFLGGCASEGYQPYATRGLNTPYTGEHDVFTLERTACFGFCPVYKVSVDDRDILVFEGERYVKEAGGAVSKRLAPGSFRKLVAIAQDYDFASYDARYPNEDGDNCGAVATDLPSIEIAFDAGRFDHAVRLDQGCMGFDGRERFDEMVLKIDEVLNLDDWIGPREDFYGAKE